jgi:hypothetical protein
MWTLKGILKTLGLAALASHGARGQTQKNRNVNKYKAYIPPYNPAMNNISYWRKGKSGSGGRSKHPGWTTSKSSESKRKREINIIDELGAVSKKLNKARSKTKRKRD